jgi:hypothetical protein
MDIIKGSGRGFVNCASVIDTCSSDAIPAVQHTHRDVVICSGRIRHRLNYAGTIHRDLRYAARLTVFNNRRILASNVPCVPYVRFARRLSSLRFRSTTSRAEGAVAGTLPRTDQASRSRSHRSGRRAKRDMEGRDNRRLDVAGLVSPSRGVCNSGAPASARGVAVGPACANCSASPVVAVMPASEP